MLLKCTACFLYFPTGIESISKMMSFACTNFSLVTNAMIHAILAKQPKNRYVVGYDAKYVFLPLSYLPINIQVMCPLTVALNFVTSFLWAISSFFTALLFARHFFPSPPYLDQEENDFQRIFQTCNK